MFTRRLMIQLHYFYLLLSYYNYHNWIIGVLIRFCVNRNTRRYDRIEIQNKKMNTTDHANFILYFIQRVSFIKALRDNASVSKCHHTKQ